MAFLNHREKTARPRTLTDEDVSEIKRMAHLPREELREIASATQMTSLDPAFLFGFSPVSRADAVAELSFMTGNEELDFIHATLIDCVQQGFLNVVRDNKGVLRFGITPDGQEHVNRFLGLE